MCQQELKEEFSTFQGHTSHVLPVQDNQYISQFLVFDEAKNETEGVDEMESMKMEGSEHEDEIFEETSPIEESSEVSLKPKRSPLHNFQKHFVTTIRRTVRINWPSEMPEHLSLAKEMWEIFRNSKKYTKEFVSLILGQNDSNIDQNLFKKYGLAECLKSHSTENFLLAQAFLKGQVLETFKTIPKQKLLYERRIAKKEEFANYFFKILLEIEEGVMNKRLPKKKTSRRRNSKSTLPPRGSLNELQMNFFS